MRPDIDGLVVALEQTFAKATTCVMVDSVASFDVLIIDLIFICLICSADVGVYASG